MKRLICIAPLAALMLGASAGAAREPAAPQQSIPYQWRNVKVGGGGFAPGIVFSPAERGLAYLRTDMGGAYRWDDAQRRWIPLQDDESEPSYMGIESIAPDPHNADIVYMAAGMGSWGPAAIFRSTDRGDQWRRTPVPFKMGGNENGRGLGERLAVDPNHPSTLFFGSRHDGLWRSDDSAAHWHKVDGFPLPGLGTPTKRRETHGGLSFVLFDPKVAGRIFVGSADPGPHHLFRSDDGGKSWAAVAGGPADLLAVKAAIGSDHRLTITYCDSIGPSGITRGAVWRFDPTDSKWRDVTPLKGDRALPGGYMGVAVSAQNPKEIAVSTVDRSSPVDTVWRSTDGGDHWDELYRHSVRDVSATPFLDFDGKANFGHWIAGLAIDPFDDDHAAYVTGATLYATHEFGTDKVMHWAPWTQGIEQTAVITLTSPTGGAHLVSGFGDIAGFRHDDLTVSPPHMHLNPFHPNTNTLDYAGLAPNIMVRSGSDHSKAVHGSSIAWSNDGGGSWQPLTLPASAPAADDALPPERTGDAAITVSADGTTFLVETTQPLFTRDRGAHWQPVSGLPSRVRVTADKVDPKRFYAIDFATNRIVRSEDGGAHFHALASTGLPDDLSPAHETNREAPPPILATPGRAGMLWMRLDSALYRSTDFGATWQRAPGRLSISRFGLGKGAASSDWPALYAVGEQEGVRGIFRSTDGGAQWRRINDDKHQWGLRIRMLSGDPRRFGRVYIATDGRGIIYGDPTASSGEK